MQKLALVSLVVWLGAGVGACGSSPSTPAEPAPAPLAPAPAPAPAAAPAQPPPTAAAAAAPTSTIDDPAFLLRAVAAGPYKAGELGRFVVELQSRGIYHVNQEYPIEIAVTGAPDTVWPKPKLERADVAEITLKQARFEVPFTAKAAGQQTAQINVKFAVCTDANCVPDERNLSLALAIQ